MTRVGAVTSSGTPDEHDVARAVEIVGAQAVSLWHKDADLHGVDAVVIPDGFPYGDCLRCGVIVATAPVMSETMREAGQGLPVLGIRNGFQVLYESHLLPGTPIRNDHQKFLCRDQVLRIENADTVWTRAYGAGDIITVPLKNGEGNFQAAPAEPEWLEGEGRVVFRYVDFNPNGPANDIVGVINAAGNAVGLISHPEHATEVGFGLLSLGPDGASHRGGTDGLDIFRSVPASLAD